MGHGEDDRLLKGSDVVQDFSECLKRGGYSGAGLDNNAWARHDRFMLDFYARLEGVLGEKRRSAVDIGFGTGATTHALSHMFNQVTAFEIDRKSTDLALERKRIFDLSNVEFVCSEPAGLIDDALEVAKPDSVFFFYAVLEHMTEAERLDSLKKVWDFMGPDNYLFVGNTPNRLSYTDLHTYEHPFLFSLPDLTCLRYLQRNQDIRFSNQLLHAYEEDGLEGFALRRARRGMGVSFHDFEIAFSLDDLNEVVVLADLSRPWSFWDAILTAYFVECGVDAPLCFAMRNMNFLIKKPSGRKEAEAAKEHNAGVREDFARISASVFAKYVERVQERGRS